MSSRRMWASAISVRSPTPMNGTPFAIAVTCTATYAGSTETDTATLLPMLAATASAADEDASGGRAGAVAANSAPDTRSLRRRPPPSAEEAQPPTLAYRQAIDRLAICPGRPRAVHVPPQPSGPGTHAVSPRLTPHAAHGPVEYVYAHVHADDGVYYYVCMCLVVSCFLVH